MVKVPEYPDVARMMCGGKKRAVSISIQHEQPRHGSPFQLENVEIVKNMTIDDKIKFWREVMQYAKDRGMDIYLFTWNIFVWGTEGNTG